MRKALITALLFTPLAAAANTPWLTEMKQKCDQEKHSIFRPNTGTPTCDRLDKLHIDYDKRTQELTQALRNACATEQRSIFRPNQGTPSCDRLQQVLLERAEQPVGSGYRYSRERGAWCHFNDVGDVQSCP